MAGTGAGPGSVWVVGSINVDVVATVAALPRPGETVVAGDVSFHPGGKGANQAVAAARAGARARLVGRVGDDHLGADALTFLGEAGVDTSPVEPVAGAATGTALVTVEGGGENTVVVGAGANGKLTARDVAGLPFAPADAVVVQLEVPVEVVTAAVDAGHRAGATVVANPAPARPVPDRLFEPVDVLVVNETELAVYSGREVGGRATVAVLTAAAHRLRRRDGQVVVVTLGRRGALAVGPGGRGRSLPAPRVEAVDTTGAGDCFVGSLAARVVAGDPLDDALAYAVAASSVCVQRRGAAPAMPRRSEVWAAH